LISKLGVLVLTLVAARALDAVTFGEFIGFWAIALLAAALWDAGGSTLVTREIAAGATSLHDALWAASSIRVRTFVLWLAVFAAGLAIVTTNTEAGAGSVLIFAVGSLVFSIHTVLTAALRGQLRFGAAATTTALGRLVTAAAAFVVFSVSHDHRLGALGGAIALGELATALAAAVALRRRAHPRGVPSPSVSPRPITVRASLPFAANGLLAIAYNRLDVVLVAGLASATQLGLYAPASRMQDAASILPATMGIVALPFLASTHDTAVARRFVRRFAVYGIAIATVVAAVAFVFMPQILEAVLGEKYVDATVPCRILIWFLPFAAATAPLLAFLTAQGRAAATNVVFAAAFSVAIALHLALDWWWGARGAAVASLARDPVAAAVAFVLVERTLLLPRRVRARAGVAAPVRLE
jgi:O-antigen/teichoic acid export membrane protein